MSHYFYSQEILLSCTTYPVLQREGYSQEVQVRSASGIPRKCILVLVIDSCLVLLLSKKSAELLKYNLE